MAVNHLIFDIGNTIVNFNLHLASEKLGRIFGVPEPDIYRFAFKSGFFTDFERGSIGPDELVSKLNQQFGQDLSLSTFDGLFSPIFSERPEMGGIISRLKGTYELSLLSNTNVLHSRYLEAHFPILMEFDHRFYSHSLKALKPDFDIYQTILSLTHSDARECLFIDDLETNVLGAQKAGLDAIHFKNEEMLLAELSVRELI